MAPPSGVQAQGVPYDPAAVESEPRALAEELAAAATRLGSSHPRGALFFEDREDLRVVLDADRRREIVPSRLRGLAARSDPASSRAAHLADPAPGDALRLVGAVLGGEPGPVRGASPSGVAGAGSSRLDAGDAVRILERVVHLASLRAGRDAKIEAWWVGAEQTVLIARPGAEVRSDLRRSRRLGVRVRLGGGAAAAVAERVLKSDLEPDLESVAAEVSGRAIERAHASAAKPGETQVVFASGTGGILIHEIVGHALEADTVARGGSLLASRREPVAPPDILVLDDPRRGRAAWRVDDEGFDARATPLLQEGIVRGVLHSETTANRSEESPTGHGRRSSFQEPALPRMGCTFLAPGTLRPDDVLEGIAEGVLVRRMEAASVEPGTGEAVFRVTDADAVRGERVQEPLNPFHLYVTTLTALASLDGLGDDLAFDSCIGSCLRAGQAVATSVGAPTFRIRVARVLDG